MIVKSIELPYGLTIVIAKRIDINMEKGVKLALSMTSILRGRTQCFYLDRHPK